ncbi:hypothetical protein PCASD_03932 [Puccinia coronata f. sp. avenae]|uniref:Uncharacterized protein n=1 Tax=Puccinia coronata f. sp. avenae TaxID=200324 RepID=A0A2N5VAL5_9BASI|nr:hypothetical protein PCASD_03932 [Puccinia coronata f. sp. avenae]
MFLQEYPVERLVPSSNNSTHHGTPSSRSFSAPRNYAAPSNPASNASNATL